MCTVCQQLPAGQQPRYLLLKVRALDVLEGSTRQGQPPTTRVLRLRLAEAW